MSNNASRKRPAALSRPPPAKQALMTQEEEFMDEDVFLDETLVSEDEESLILRDIEQRQALATRLSKWTRPPLSSDYLTQSRSVIFQQLEIDYAIGESYKEFLLNSSVPAAIIRIFGVTKEGDLGFERTLAWIITCILFMCVLAGGGCLVAYTFFPESQVPLWTPFLGITLVCLPWTFWLLTFLYRIFSRCYGCRISVAGIGKEGLGDRDGGHGHEIAPETGDTNIIAK